jgi:transposase
MSTPVAEPFAAPRSPRSRVHTRLDWIDRLARFPLSGLTTAQFCAAEGVSLPSFYAWKRRLANDQANPADSPDTQPQPRLLPVRLPAAVPLELVLPNGTLLRLVPGCDLEFVRALLRTLGETPC